MEIETNTAAENTTVDQNAAAREAAQARVEAANASVASTKEASDTAAAAAKEAAKNHKQAVAYNKSVADDAEGKADAQSTEQGWAAEAERTKGEAEAAKASLAAAREELKTAKSELKAIGKAPKPAGEANRTRNTLPDDAILTPVEGATVAKGVMSIVTNAFDGQRTLAEAREEIKANINAAIAEGKSVKSAQWNEPDTYVNGYVKGAIKAGYLSAPASA